MKQVEISDEEAKRAVLRAMLRQKTGINPEAINRGVREITRTVNTIKELARRDADDSFLAKLSRYVDATAQNLCGMRCGIAFALVVMYERCLPLNVKLYGSEMLPSVDEKTGMDEFDAALIEDRIIDLFPKFNVMAYDQLLEDARTMLPTPPIDRPLSVRDIQKGNTLVLCNSARLSRDGEVETIGKLSRVVLLRDEAATVRGCKQKKNAPRCNDIAMRAGEPIRLIRRPSDHGLFMMDAVYATSAHARKVARALLWNTEEQKST